MKGRAALLLILLLSATGGLTSCGGMELNERAFVLGIALDLDEHQQYRVTTQLYSSGQERSDNPATGNVINIVSHGASIGEGVRDITLHLGRKAQWGHTQMLLIGEQLARSPRFREALDFFYRDDEPRLTLRLTVVKGEAGPYLEHHAYIEKSVSRQARNIQHISKKFSGKTTERNMLQLALDLHSESGIAVLPYADDTGNRETRIYYKGGAIMRNGRMVARLNAKQMPYYLMLKGDYSSGFLGMPCSDGGSSESLEILALQRRVKLHPQGEELQVQYSLQISAIARELSCTALRTEQDAERYTARIDRYLEEQLDRFSRGFMEQGLDVLALGDAVHRRYPRVWTSWKPDWDKRLPRIRPRIDVQVHVVNLGLEGGTAVFGEDTH
ncbi:Ger(x)C family spore germination protein [Paenibacillus sp. IB182496]|uniref:Ger(X)C family spore germination protein n=1 Tax=Paenibacillus sabuli TaxID=2772509 RepID=A0A927GR22_9BACL|nr:Ger(x)C family spore germination protein [Paenibacillus sabuli]MBD2844983.1 Ger(x)C family spore germination protein [Paenibacillus sabuli]